MNESGKYDHPGNLPSSVMSSLTGIATAKEIDMSKTQDKEYSPSNWHWDPHQHMPVYVHHRCFVNDPESQNGQIEYAHVSYPSIHPKADYDMIIFETTGTVAANIVPIRNQFEFQL